MVCSRTTWPATPSKPICAGATPTATGVCSGRSAATSTRRLRTSQDQEQQRAIADAKYMFRRLPGVVSPLDWDVWGQQYPEPAAPSDREAILDLVLVGEGEASAAIAARWWQQQPEGFFVVRSHDGMIGGFLALLDLTRASPEDIAADPGASAAWDYAQQHAPPRPTEMVTLSRFIVDRDAYQGPSATLNAMPILTMQRYLATPSLAWDFLALAEPEQWDEYFAAADLPRAAGADFWVGGRRYGLFAHDFRQVPVDALLELVTERALSQDATPSAVDGEAAAAGAVPDRVRRLGATGVAGPAPPVPVGPQSAAADPPGA